MNLTLYLVVGVVVGILGIIIISYYAKKELNHIIAEQQVVESEEENLEEPPRTNCDDNDSIIEPTEIASDNER